MRRKIDPTVCAELTKRYLADESLDDRELTTLARGLLEELASRVPGRSVEIRIPYVGAAQIVDGPRHTRGTPPSVIELDVATWIDLGVGRLDWAAALDSGRVNASGLRVDLTDELPLGQQ